MQFLQIDIFNKNNFRNHSFSKCPFYFFLNVFIIYLFIWLYQVIVAAY